jgi:hypothetical protein
MLFLLSRRELLALTLLFFLSLPAVTTRLYSSDEVQYFSYLRSLYFDRDVSFENEYRYFYDRNVAQSAGFHETFLERQTNAGRRVNYATMGCAILWLPFYAVADGIVRATGIAEADGFSKPYVRAVAYGSAFYGFLAVLLSIRAARVAAVRGSGDQATFWAGVAVWLGTPLLFYMYVAPPFSHACSAFGVALFVNVWLQVRRQWSAGGTFALGLCAALLALIREQDVFVALGPLVDFALAVTTANLKVQTPNGLRGLRGLAVVGAGVGGVAVAYVPQLLAYNALNGYPGPASHVARKMYWYAPHGLQVLLSPDHGFFFWTPLAILGIAGLIVLATRRTSDDASRVGVASLVMVATQVYVAGSVASWTVAGAFGQRRFVCLTVVLVIGLATIASFARVKYIAAIAAICIWWNIALMFQFATGMMDRQRLEPGRNAYNAFVRVPLEAPSLVYRYLTDRDSFYRPPPPPPARTP